VRVKAAEPRARFLFSGYEGDPAPFRQLAAEAGLQDVSAMVGRLAHDEFAVALRASDVFISVPSVDATAVSLLEAMSTGMAVIISSLASSLEWIADGVSGLVVPPRDEVALAAAMLRLGQDPQLRQSCGASALAGAHQYAGFQSNMQVVDGIFSHLTGREAWPVGARLVDLRREPV
jgi:glycosyltransferase involved in cell wall biosynthesis